MSVLKAWAALGDRGGRKSTWFLKLLNAFIYQIGNESSFHVEGTALTMKSWDNVTEAAEMAH